MMLIYWQGVSWKIPWSGDSDVAEYFHKCLTFVWLALICVHSSLTLFRCSWCFCQICRPRQRCRPEWKHSSLRPTASRKSFNLSVETLLELYFCTFLHWFFPVSVSPDGRSQSSWYDQSGGVGGDEADGSDCGSDFGQEETQSPGEIPG